MLQQPPSEWHWALQAMAAVVIAALVVLLAWVGLLRAQPQDLAAERLRQQQLQQQYRDRLTAAASLPALRGQHAMLEQQQQAHAALKPAPAKVQELLASLHQSGARHGVQLEQLQPGKEKRHAGHARQLVGFRARGPYAAVAGFFHALPDMPQAVVVERWTLAMNRGAARRGDNSLVLQGKLATYRFTEASEQKTHKRGRTGGEKR